LPGAGDVANKCSDGELLSKLQQTLVTSYGTRAEFIARIAAERVELAQRMAPGTPVIAAQGIRDVRNECARSIVDFIARRTHELQSFIDYVKRLQRQA
jgi:glycerol-3-phosphate dehydrogenase